MIDRVEGLNLKIRISKRVYHFEYCASEDEEPRARGAKLMACISTLDRSTLVGVIQLTLQNSEDSIHNRIVLKSTILFGKSNDNK